MHVAVMQDQQPGAEASMIITAYSKTEDAPSRIEIRWNERKNKDDINGKTLWAVERETGKMAMLATLSADTNKISLTKAQWQMVKNSLELQVREGYDTNSNIILQGTCLQLTDWG